MAGLQRIHTDIHTSSITPLRKRAFSHKLLNGLISIICVAKN